MSTLIIAEAGVNHNGSIQLALDMCDAARQAGADVVKFQTFRTECNVLRQCTWVDYQQENAPEFDSHWEMLKALELSDSEFARLKVHCDEIGIEFMSTPSDKPSLELLDSLDVKTLKISSSDVSNRPLLRQIGEVGRSVILSTGMSTLEELDAAVEVLGKDRLTLMHCHTAYPSRFEDVNLRCIATLRDRYEVDVGFSDHTPGVAASVAAVALGASVIEKHFSVNKSLPGPDQKMSLDPGEFQELIEAIRHTEQALGDGAKRLSTSEREIRDVYGKGIVARRPIRKGEVLSEQNITVKRPCLGIPVTEWDRVIGQTACRNFETDEPIQT